jgi:hypothetical protein
MKVKKCEWQGKTVYVFRCPGCKENHYFDDRWTFNGDYDNPTFSPSLHIKYGKSSNEEMAYLEGKTVCHSFVRNGKIAFLNDCEHELGGQTVEMKDIN